jgi:hypothetical protein
MKTPLAVLVGGPGRFGLLPARSSHRSGRAQLRHPARQVTGSPTCPERWRARAPTAAGSAASSAGSALRKGSDHVGADGPTISSRSAGPRPKTAATNNRCRSVRLPDPKLQAPGRRRPRCWFGGVSCRSARPPADGDILSRETRRRISGPSPLPDNSGNNLTLQTGAPPPTPGTRCDRARCVLSGTPSLSVQHACLAPA